MRKSIILLGAAAGLAACGSTTGNSNGSNAAANVATPEQPKPAYCFFKPSETKDWAAKADKDGNVVITGKAYREDSRYKATLSPAVVSGTSAEVAPTITTNDTGFAARGNWWDVTETIPDSQAVATVTVKCGGDTLASLTVPRKK